MKNNYLARQKRQFKGLCKKISKNWNSLSSNQRENLLSRFRRLYGNLKNAFARPALSKMMGAAAVVLMSAGGVNAQHFKAPVQNPYGLSDIGANSTISFVDIDNDGDFDLFSGERDGSFYFFLNTGSPSLPVFAAASTNPFGLSDIGDVSKATFGDVDNDGDFDMISGETYGSFYFFENTGGTLTTPNFIGPTVDTFNLSPVVGVNGGTYNLGTTNPVLVDLDNDGDLDVITGEYYGSFYFYENNGDSVNANFSTGVKNAFGLSTITPGTSGYNNTVPSIGDLDNDGDLDMISGGRYGEFVYFENNGSIAVPSFLAQNVNPYSLDSIPVGSNSRYSSPAFVDIDNDGDLDIFSGTQAGDIYFYENDISSIPASVVNILAEYNIYPNPVSEELNIELATSANYQIRITDITGREVYSNFLQGDNNLQLSTKAWPAGLYLLQVRDEEGNVETKKVVKQ